MLNLVFGARTAGARVLDAPSIAPPCQRVGGPTNHGEGETSRSTLSGLSS